MKHVVLASDNNYLQNLVTVLISINESTKDKSDLRVTVIENDIDKKTQILIQRLFDFAIDFHHFTVPDCNLPLNFYKSPLVYARLWIESIKNPGLRIVYLDCDVLVKTDIEALFLTNLADNVIGATQDAFISSLSHPLGPTYLGLTHNYFNSGVMVIDFTKWEKTQVISNGLKIIRQYRESIRFVDQEVLNCIFAGDFHEIDISWNYQTLFRWNPLGLPLNKNLVKGDFVPVSRPNILHFNSMQINGNKLIKSWDFPLYDESAIEWLSYFNKAGLLLTGND